MWAKGRGATPVLRFQTAVPSSSSGRWGFRGPCLFFTQSGRPGLAHESSGGGGLPPSPPTRHQMGGGGGRAPWSSRVSVRTPRSEQRHHFAQCERPFLLAHFRFTVPLKEKRENNKRSRFRNNHGEEAAPHPPRAAFNILLTLTRPRLERPLPAKRTRSPCEATDRAPHDISCQPNLQEPDQSAPRPRRQPRLCPPHFAPSSQASALRSCQSMCACMLWRVGLQCTDLPVRADASFQLLRRYLPNPRAATSVATKIGDFPLRNSVRGQTQCV